MSWLNKLTSGIFSRSQDKEQILPRPPSVMAAGAPWYEEIAPPKQEVVARIRKDILQQNPELKVLNLQYIIGETMSGVSIGSYRDYYANRHRILVNEARDDALEIHKKRHTKNMKWFYFICTTKARIHTMVKKFRKRRRRRQWEEMETQNLS